MEKIKLSGTVLTKYTTLPRRLTPCNTHEVRPYLRHDAASATDRLDASKREAASASEWRTMRSIVRVDRECEETGAARHGGPDGRRLN
jgi:hypothetical protein